MSLTLCIEENVNIHPSFSIEETFGALEGRRIAAIKNERRRAETVAGVSALKKALLDRVAGEITRDARGRPHFSDASGVDFSISHSGALSVAAVFDCPSARVGIDIEIIDEKKEDMHRRITERYFSDEERAVFSACPTPLEFFKLWTAKEARAKLSGLGLAEIISNERTSLEKDKEYFISHFLVTYNSEKYILAVCTDKNEKIDFICGGAVRVSAIQH